LKFFLAPVRRPGEGTNYVVGWGVVVVVVMASQIDGAMGKGRMVYYDFAGVTILQRTVDGGGRNAVQGTEYSS